MQMTEDIGLAYMKCMELILHELPNEQSFVSFGRLCHTMKASFLQRLLDVQCLCSQDLCMWMRIRSDVVTVGIFSTSYNI